MQRKKVLAAACILVCALPIFAQSSASFSYYKNIRQLYAAGQYDLVLQKSRDYATIYPRGAELYDVYQLTATVYERRAQFSRAISVYFSMIAHFPDDIRLPELYNKTGDLYARIGDDANAIQNYVYVIDNYPDSVYSEYANAQLQIKYGFTL